LIVARLITTLCCGEKGGALDETGATTGKPGTSVTGIALESIGLGSKYPDVVEPVEKLAAADIGPVIVKFCGVAAPLKLPLKPKNCCPDTGVADTCTTAPL
jgi:hypothetical protein